jgi:hypothetical protein
MAAEAAALRGMAETLKRCRPVLIVERLSREALMAVREATEPLGYRECRWLGPDGPVAVSETLVCPQPDYGNVLLRASA